MLHELLSDVGSQLGVIDVKRKTLTQLDTGFTAFGKLAVVGGGVDDADAGLTIVTTAGSAGKASAVVQLQVSLSLGKHSVIKANQTATLPAASGPYRRNQAMVQHVCCNTRSQQHCPVLFGCLGRAQSSLPSYIALALINRCRVFLLYFPPSHLTGK